MSTVTDDWKGHTVPLSEVFLKRNDELKGEFYLNHNRVVGMTLMFPLKLVRQIKSLLLLSAYEIKLALCK